jgi:hypothetical protein
MAEQVVEEALKDFAIVVRHGALSSGDDEPRV